MLAGLGVTAIARQTVSAIGAVLHLERRNGVRRLVALGRFATDGRGRLSTEHMTARRVAGAHGGA